METIFVIVSVVLVLVFAFLLFFLLSKYKEVESKQENERIEELKREKQELSKKNEELVKENSVLLAENEKLKTKLEESEKFLNEKLEILKKSEKELKEKFENIANKILEETKSKSEKSISLVIEPLKTQMKDFKEKLEQLNLQETERISALQNELKNLKDLSMRLSNDAENLTKALKGESKVQGNWGEVVLKKVLELSGLEEKREFEIQVDLKNDENKHYRPDAIVHLPSNRDVIIDAKTSLKGYEMYVETDDEAHLDSLVASIRRHIDELSNKAYEKLKGVNSLDFVLMFVPIENALTLALKKDKNLFEYAFERRIVLVSPTTLLVALRAIENSWRIEKQVRNVEEIIKTAENLYDKVRGFTEDFEKIGKALENANSVYDSALKKLTSGRGNVLKQIDLIKEKAGIRPKKEINQDLMDRARIEQDFFKKDDKLT